MWSVDPTVNSDLFNVHGIGAQGRRSTPSSRPPTRTATCTDLPLYDPLDDDSVEAFRRRFPHQHVRHSVVCRRCRSRRARRGCPKFDERFYALRTGLQNWVTSPSTEIADDLMAVRLGAEQRWQTKRGPPDNRHIIDWITLDTNITFFPNANRDNFGQTAGLFDYDFRWHVGDRLTLVSDGIFDFFDQGQKIVTVGGFLTRPPRGSLYVGFRILEGPIDSKVLALSYTYWMSPKWVSSFGTSIDFGSRRKHRPELQHHAGRRVVPDQRRLHGRSRAQQRRREPRHRAAIPAQEPAGQRRRRADSARRSVWVGMMNARIQLLAKFSGRRYVGQKFRREPPRAPPRSGGRRLLNASRRHFLSPRLCGRIPAWNTNLNLRSVPPTGCRWRFWRSFWRQRGDSGRTRATA